MFDIGRPLWASATTRGGGQPLHPIYGFHLSLTVFAQPEGRAPWPNWPHFSHVCMRHLILPIVAVSLACSTASEMSRPLSEAARGELLLAATSNDRWSIQHESREIAHQPHLEGEVLKFVSTEGRPREVPVAALRSIVVDVNHLHGAFDGLMLGLLGGAAVGATTGFSLGSDPPLPPGSDCGPCSFTAGQKAILGGLAGGVVGGALGLIVGAIIGHREEIVFTPSQTR
jgi:hypothetical protein